MGTVNSVDTRRISFDNNLATTPAITVQNSIVDNIDDVLHIENIPIINNDNDLSFKDDQKFVEAQDGGENEYWNQRLESLKKEHQFINKIVESEYEKTVEFTKKYYEAPNNITIEKLKKIKPCLDWRLKIMQCYEENSRQPLVCSGIVQAFTECVAACRSHDK